MDNHKNQLRLFTAILLPEPLFSEALHIQDALMRTAPGILKKIPATNLHLTLNFFGSHPIEYVDVLIKRLEMLFLEEYTIAFDGLELHPRGQSALIWIRVKKHCALMALQESIEEAVRPLPTTRRTYLPHITLFRIPFVQNLRDLRRSLEGIRVPAAACSQRGFSLMQSISTSEGVLYEELHSF